MIRLNLMLVAIAVVCALAAVTSQHEARKLFGRIEEEQKTARQLDVEWDQLQLEQSTWAQHTRVEKIATQRLQMRLPAGAHAHVIQTGATAGAPAR